MAERLFWEQEAVGSRPAYSTTPLIVISRRLWHGIHLCAKSDGSADVWVRFPPGGNMELYLSWQEARGDIAPKCRRFKSGQLHHPGKHRG